MTTITKLEVMNALLANEISVAQDTIDRFRTTIANAVLDGPGQVTNSSEIAHEIRWQTEDVLRAATVLNLLLPVRRYLDGDRTLNEKIETLSFELQSSIDHLTGGKWGCTEPWRANSTSALSNLDNIAGCSAHQVFIKVLTPIVAELKSLA